MGKGNYLTRIPNEGSMFTIKELELVLAQARVMNVPDDTFVHVRTRVLKFGLPPVIREVTIPIDAQ